MLSLSSLSPLITRLNSGALVPLHHSFRDWLLKGSAETDYSIDVRQALPSSAETKSRFFRQGHILHALALVRSGTLNPEQLFELGHHLLKANPHKYMQPGLAADLPSGRDCQILWVQHAAGEAIATALLFERNVFYPNSKVWGASLSVNVTHPRCPSCCCWQAPTRMHAG